MKIRKVVSTIGVAICLVFVLCISAFSCTDVVAGKDATVDGSVITSHTADGAFYDARVRPIPGKTFPEGSKADVFWNIINDEYGPPVKIGEIPQVKETYTYFHVGYPFFNEHGIAIGETTIAQKDELKTFRPDAKAIMTVEQLEVFALQRSKTAREAVKVIGSLAEKYGFLPSCASNGECVTITDKDEAWVMEIFGVGFTWTPESGKPGAIWAAKRVPDDEVVVVPNISRITEINPKDTDNYMVSEGYMEPAIEHGFYDPDSGEPFNWQQAYSPRTGNDGWSLSSMWVRNRLFYTYRSIAPSMEWDPNAEVSSYPFSVKPEKKISVADVMAYLRCHMQGTEFDMEGNPAWMVCDGEKCAISPLATPFPGKDLRQLLNIPYSRPTAKWDCAYSFVSQVRADMPSAIGAVLWFGYDNPHTTCYVPIYAGVQSTPETWRTFDRNEFNLNSAQWSFILADDLVNRRYQDTIKDLEAVRAPLEKKFFDNQKKVETEAMKLYKEDPEKAEKYLTDYTNSCMKEVEKAWWLLNWDFIAKYNNNKGF